MPVRRRAASPSSELVLIVDDEREARQLYVESLTGFGFRVELAADTLDALSRSLFHPAIICVHVPPGSPDRLEFCRRVRQNPRTRQIPIVAIIAGHSPGETALAREAGVDSMLTMPCLPESLGAEIRRVLSRTRAVKRLSAVPTPATAARLEALRARVTRFRTFLKARLPDRKG